MGYSRQKLQDDIFMTCAAIIDADKNHSHTNPLFINDIKKMLTEGGLYEVNDFDAELNYLIEVGYFRKIGTHFIRPTAEGYDKIWGKTTHSSNTNPMSDESDLLKLKPEFYGVGINLKVLWNRIKMFFKYPK